MRRIKTIFLAIICITLSNCKTEQNKFPTDKRFWDTTDYANVVRELRYSYGSDEKLPTFDNPETRIIVQKLTDQENFNVVLDDPELGINHKNDVAEKFFIHWKNMTSIYQATDRKDKYLYDREMIEVYQFGLGLQLKYFKLGNDQIKANADDPNSNRVKNNINSNVNTLINNYLNYLDEVNNEKALSENGKELFANGIDKYFTALIELYPTANYSAMEKKVDLMYKKSESEKIKSSLLKIKELINSKRIVDIE